MASHEKLRAAETPSDPLSTLRMAGLILGPLVAIALLLTPAPEAMPAAAWRMVAMTASMAFMMPVATPPNAIVFAYEEMTLADMVRAGMVLNLLAIAVVYGLFWLIGPTVFGFEW